MEGFQAHLEGKTPEYVCEHRMLHKDGSIRWVRARGTAIRGVQGNIIRVVGTDVDITDRKQVEEALRESEEKFMKAFKSSPNLVAITRMADGRIVDVNDSFIHASGYSREELIGISTTELGLWTQPVKRDEFVKALQKDRQVHNMEVEIRAKSGEVLNVLLSGAMLSLTGRGPHMIAMANDITRWKQIEDQLLDAQKLESIGVLAGGIAHDFNNILTGILGNIYLARVYRDSDKVRERLEEAEKASLHAKELAQRLLTFSYGGAPIKRIANVAELLENSASFALSGSNVRCEFSIPDDLWPLNIDKQQINQVIHNVVINADQAMPEGGTIRIIAENVTIEAESTVPLGSGDYVRISIQDQGMGIPEEDLRRVFDPYFSTKQTGSGLGLAISHSIIRSHSGLITVESRIDMGTTFHIYLPACLKKLTGTTWEEAEDEIPAGRGKVLVMDDEEIIRDLLMDMLTSIGYEVTAVTDGAEVITLYKEAKESGSAFDAVIIDLTIPGGMGGKETVQKLMEVDSEVKAIVSSGYSRDPIMANYERYGFKGVVAKPYSPGELGELLHRLITGNA